MLSRARIAVGLVAVVMGTAWASGSLPLVARRTLFLAPFLLLGVAVLLAVRALAPRATLIGPAGLAVVAAVWLAIRYSNVAPSDTLVVLPLLVVVGGCVVALWKHRPLPRIDPVRRCLTAFSSRTLRLAGADTGKVAATAVVGCLVVDLGDCAIPRRFRSALELDVTLLLGKIEVIVPSGWSVVVGRVHARAVGFAGPSLVGRPVLSPADLDDETEPRRANRTDPVVILNVVGALSRVEVSNAPAPQAPREVSSPEPRTAPEPPPPAASP